VTCVPFIGFDEKNEWVASGPIENVTAAAVLASNLCREKNDDVRNEDRVDCAGGCGCGFYAVGKG
jgi:hypothetical protein